MRTESRNSLYVGISRYIMDFSMLRGAIGVGRERRNYPGDAWVGGCGGGGGEGGYWVPGKCESLGWRGCVIWGGWGWGGYVLYFRSPNLRAPEVRRRTVSPENTGRWRPVVGDTWVFFATSPSIAHFTEVGGGGCVWLGAYSICRRVGAYQILERCVSRCDSY